MHSCLRECMCLCTVSVITVWIFFHSSSVSPSKGTPSVSIWMLLGSLLPTQPIGVRLKEGRQPMSCWYTTAGSGSGLASASGSWNFRNWLAFSKPPKGMANLIKQGEMIIKAPVCHKEPTVPSQALREVPVEAFVLAHILFLNGTRHCSFQSGYQTFITLHGLLPWRHVRLQITLLSCVTSTSCEENIQG